MATSGTPNEGLDEIADRAYISGTDLILVAYQNTANSLSATTVLADLIQPATANGYAPITLSGTWSSSDGLLAYDHPGNPGWSSTGTWGADVIGTALVTATSIVHFKDLDSPFAAANGRTLSIDLTTLVT